MKKTHLSVLVLCCLAQAGQAAVGDFTRTVVSTKLNGNEGVSFIKWEKETTTTGRAWAVKIDLTKGYRIRTQLGDAKANKATVGEMAETLIAAGEAPIMGMNADYFDVNVTYARCTGMLITDSRLAFAGFGSGVAPDYCYIAETGDHNLRHGPFTRAAGLTSGDAKFSYQVLAGGLKVRQAVRTNYCNYPVRGGVMNPVGGSSGGATFPTTIGNMQNRKTYPRPLVGITTNAQGVATQLMFFVNDGRQANWSNDFPDVDAYQIMIDEGCNEVGEFDGGGSAAMWMANGADTICNSSKTEHGVYVNKPSDGSPRKDACGIFLLPPDTRSYNVSINGANTYPTLDEALDAAAPGETISIDGATTLATNVINRSCTIVAPNRDQGVVTRSTVGALTIPSGVRVCFSNVAFSASETLSVASGAVAAFAGKSAFSAVNVAEGGALEIAGPLEDDLVVNYAVQPKLNDVFCTFSSGNSYLASSIAHVKVSGAGQALALQVTGHGTGGIVRWVSASQQATDGAFDIDSYAKDGLVAHFDAVDNAATGAHDSSAAKWLSRVGSATITKNTGASWGPSWFDTSTVDHNISNLPVLKPSSITVEVCANVLSNGIRSGTSAYPRLFRAAERFDVYFSKSGSSATLYVNQNTNRVSFGNYRSGTLTTISDATNYRAYVDGILCGSSGSVAISPTAASLATYWNLNGSSGYLHGIYRALRFYDRALTTDEIARHTWLDRLRFYGYSAAPEGTVSWSALAWNAPWNAAERPDATTNALATITGGKVTVAASDKVALAILVVQNGATLDLAQDAVVSIKELYLGTNAVPRGIYTGSGAVGTQVDWLAGEGVLRVAGSSTATIPWRVPVADADGWYAFGLPAANGGAANYETGYSQKPSSKYHSFKAERPIWGEYAFPVGAKLRLRGYILLETIPADTFAAVDVSQIEFVTFHTPTPFADGSTFEIPSGATGRYQPGNWIEDGGKYWLVSNGSGAFTGDLSIKGILSVYGDGTQLASQQYDGVVSGTGTIKITSYSKQVRLRGPVNFSGSLTGFQNANLFWLDSLTATCRLSGVTLSDCSGKYQTNGAYNVSGVFFGRSSENKVAAEELYIDALKGQAKDVTDTSGKRWRTGGALCVWGGNTVHVGKITGATHVLARSKDLGCSTGWFKTAGCVGEGNLVVDSIATTGALFLSTNVNVTVGKVSSATTFDYTFHSTGVNPTTVTITNSCVTGAKVKATNLALLPARLSGFTGSVTLTETASRSYTMPIDVTLGTNGIYNTVGCIGSGTLAAAPDSGTIDVRFDESCEAVFGKYALAAFSTGGEKLANWKVLLNGEDAEAKSCRAFSARVSRDSRGLWLKIGRNGFRVILR